jgi:hypothetical protein
VASEKSFNWCCWNYWPLATLGIVIKCESYHTSVTMWWMLWKQSYMTLNCIISAKIPVMSPVTLASVIDIQMSHDWRVWLRYPSP